MTLQSSGQISMSDINVELGKSATALISLNDSDARSLAGIPSGQIALSDFYGASAGISISLTVGDNLDFNQTGEVGYRTSVYGSVSSTTLLGGRTLVAVYDYYFKGGAATTEFQVSGNQTGSWWTSWQYTGDTYGTKTFNRADATQTGGANGYYDGSTTIWIFNNSGNPTFDTSGTWTIS
jgi:hypothetical protein